jgi:hypothetical protein
VRLPAISARLAKVLAVVGDEGKALRLAFPILDQVGVDFDQDRVGDAVFSAVIRG